MARSTPGGGRMASPDQGQASSDLLLHTPLLTSPASLGNVRSEWSVQQLSPSFLHLFPTYSVIFIWITSKSMSQMWKDMHRKFILKIQMYKTVKPYSLLVIKRRQISVMSPLATCNRSKNRIDERALPYSAYGNINWYALPGWKLSDRY